MSIGGRSIRVRVAVVAAALAVSGCGAFGGYDLAPSGLTRTEEEIRRDLAFEPGQLYQAVLEDERDLPGDELLRLLYAATAGRYAGAWDESSRLLDQASVLAEDRVTRSASREALSMITSDRVLPYVPGRTERLMIPYLSALNFLEAGDVGGAAVEARRIEALLDRMYGNAPADERPANARFLHYLAGSIFHAAGDFNAADVAFRRAGPLTAELGRPGEAVVRVAFGDSGSSHVETLPELANGHGTTAPPEAAPLGRTLGTAVAVGSVRADAAQDSMGEVLVLVERGFIPHRVEQSVAVMLPPAQVQLLRDGDLAEKALAAAEAAARILGAAAHRYGDRSVYYDDRGYRSQIRLDPWQGDRCHDGYWSGTRERCWVPKEDQTSDEEPYLLPIAWPVLFQDQPRTGSRQAVHLRAGDRASTGAGHLDLSAGVRSDFNDQRADMIARTVLRAATKMVIGAGLEEAVAKDNEAARDLVGALANLGAALTERADTRSWHLLPGSVSLMRLRLPAGEHQLELEMGEEGGRALSLGTVEVEPGRLRVLTHRMWR